VMIEPLVARDDSVFISVIGRVRDENGRFIASVVEVRRSTPNRAALDLLRGLVGADAQILLGNTRDSLWSDFSRPIALTVTGADSSAGEHESDGVAYLHSIEPVPGTPWRIMVEVPTRWATARAGRVIVEIGTLAVFMMLVGVGIVWLAIHHSLRPLATVTAVVGRLANGQLGERVEVSTDDEIGDLATAFNSMADRVQDSTSQLAARAAALESANRELRHAQKMDAIGRLAGGVAHDFNNILTVIDAHAEFALASDAPEETRRDDIQQIRKASASAARLTRQLLAFSRKQALTPVPLDLNAIVVGLSGMLSRVLGQRITIHTDLSDPLWTVRADAGYLEQVIMNLAVNARDAMPEGGKLDFRTANLEIGSDYRTPAGELVPPGSYVLLTVEDSGTGMPEDVQSRAFEPFYTTKASGQGTGLGLSTVYGIVKQSGGFIWLYSEVGSGSAFKILLPRTIADEGEMAMTRTSEHRIQSLTARILIAEDQAPVRTALARAMRDAGYTVLEAASAEAAEELLARDDAVDLVVADMMMSGKTGAELAAGPLLAGRHIPVVIMSGYSEEFTNREWRLPPNSVFLDKPVAPSDLIRLINRLLLQP
jgi:signal transduction histidine kinase/CheY-like chemotaxis protein